MVDSVVEIGLVLVGVARIEGRGEYGKFPIPGRRDKRECARSVVARVDEQNVVAREGPEFQGRAGSQRLTWTPGEIPSPPARTPFSHGDQRIVPAEVVVAGVDRRNAAAAQLDHHVPIVAHDLNRGHRIIRLLGRRHPPNIPLRPNGALDHKGSFPAVLLHAGRLVLMQEHFVLPLPRGGAGSQLDLHSAAEDVRRGGSFLADFDAELGAQVGDDGGGSADGEQGMRGEGRGEIGIRICRISISPSPLSPLLSSPPLPSVCPARGSRRWRNRLHRCRPWRMTFAPVS